MVTATTKLSSKGQIVIPAELRHRLDWRTGDSIVVEFDPESQSVQMRKKETLRQMAERFSKHIRPGTPLLESASDFYSTREPRTV
ncbi:MAG: AbrB/MazE/SpoVT family DNA-binding domain-containing protein [Propionibacteriaceae bacterium]|jgi:AbrB family looped-hinge helix DNA binding protein|nr:AbrB/MazE/SpoVT family DNA-binding domain-containing protein [Propionibacteriaceae bacterium]